MPGVTLRVTSGLTETNSFGNRVYPRNEFVQIDSIKTTESTVTARMPAKTIGSVEPLYKPVRVARLKHLLATIPA